MREDDLLDLTHVGQGSGAPAGGSPHVVQDGVAEDRVGNFLTVDWVEDLLTFVLDGDGVGLGLYGERDYTPRMITNGWEFMMQIKFVTDEEFDQEAVDAIESVVRDWSSQIEATSHTVSTKIQGALYQGALLGLQIAARARKQLSERIAHDRGIDLKESH